MKFSPHPRANWQRKFWWWKILVQGLTPKTKMVVLPHFHSYQRERQQKYAKGIQIYFVSQAYFLDTGAHIVYRLFNLTFKGDLITHGLTQVATNPWNIIYKTSLFSITQIYANSFSITLLLDILVVSIVFLCREKNTVMNFQCVKWFPYLELFS